MFALLVGLLIGFGCGYGVRTIVSRRRRAAARYAAFLKEEGRYKEGFADRVQLMAALGLAETKLRR
jgi:hypothetical protein